MTIRMETLTDTYLPLTGGGHNTIRKASDKYLEMRPGEVVEMRYGPIGKNGEVATLAREKLAVCSVAIGTYADIIKHHLYANHGDMTPTEARAFFEECYGEFEDDAEFVAIYFM